MNDITLLTIISASFTFIIVLLKQAYKSKCNKIDCFCFKIHRNTNQEIEEHEFNIKNNIKDDDLENFKNSIK